MDANLISLIRDRFFYEDGKLYYKINIGTKIKKGRRAGCTNTTKTGLQVRIVKIGGKCYPEARIIWMLLYGSIPDRYKVSHRNREPLCNLLSNFELATQKYVDFHLNLKQAAIAYNKAVKVIWK
jgi:hypothetical protein